MKLFYYVTFVPMLGTTFILVFAMFFLSGCYTLKQGATMLGYLHRAVPLETLSNNPSDREFVDQIMDIRRFAIEELGLKDTSNYTRYVSLDRDYLASVVSATKPDSFTRHEWWYPVVGRLPYKGFFNTNDAKKEATRLRRRDLDVWVRGVDAFSTLGWFSDPLYSYMKNYSPYHLADLIIHESLHATIFLRGQAQFNEELAEFVGSEGARLYIEKRFGINSPEYQKMLDSQSDSAVYVSFIQELIAELDVLYKSDLDKEKKLEQKEFIIGEYKRRFETEYDNLFKSDNYRGFINLPINNAYLELFRLYYAGGSYLKDLYERSGSDLPRFITAAKTLNAKGNPRIQLEEALGVR